MSTLSRMNGQRGAGRDDRAPRQPARLIRGAQRAPELCMLPEDLAPEEIDALHARGPSERIVQLKADGLRAIYLDGQVVSREGTPLDCALHCQPGLARLEQAFDEPWVFDGEYVEDDGFNATLSAMRKGEGQGVFWLFDALPLSAWQEGGWSLRNIDRLELLGDRFPAADSMFVGLLDWWLLGAEGTRSKALELWRAGCEGLVTKCPDAGYERRRASTWRRLKQVFTADLPIVDIMVKAGRLSSVLVRSEDGPIRIGTGWDKYAALEIQGLHEAGEQLVAEIAFELTTGAKRSIRGARFVRLRLDKKGARS